MPKAPQSSVRKQHRSVPTLVVVVVVVVLVVTAGQVGPLPGTGQASQQLAHDPGVPPLASQTAALLVGRHLVLPLRIRQQVTNPGRPQVERAAQRLARPRQLRFTSVTSICAAAHCT